MQDRVFNTNKGVAPLGRKDVVSPVVLAENAALKAFAKQVQESPKVNSEAASLIYRRQHMAYVRAFYTAQGAGGNKRRQKRAAGVAAARVKVYEDLYRSLNLAF